MTFINSRAYEKRVLILKIISLTSRKTSFKFFIFNYMKIFRLLKVVENHKFALDKKSQILRKRRLL